MKIKKILIALLIFCFVFTGCSSGNGAGNGTDSRNTTKQTSKAVGFLPLDTRPCCMDIPVELAELAGAEVLMPSRDILADFDETPDLDAVRAWLTENAGSCDALVISMEQLVYGGLVQQRVAGADLSPQDKAVSVLKGIRTDYPEMPIYLSTVLMRTSPTALDEESDVWWAKVNRYSEVLYRAEVLGDAEAEAEAKQLKTEIPENVLNTFLQARDTNHQLNLKCIQLVEEGVADKLVISQEDCNEKGIQLIEQQKLKKAIEEKELYGQISMANGTDEAGAEMMMCAVCPKGAEINVMWLGDNTDFTARYEDQPFSSNIDEHMRFLNMKKSENAEMVMCVLPPVNKQGDYAEQNFTDYKAYSDEQIKQICESIKSLTDAGKKCFILDLDCANGGCLDMLTRLGQMMDITDIYGYSGWNTACNSLGTMLAQILACGGKNSKENRLYTSERIIDEAVYQSSIRTDLVKKLDEKGFNTLKLADCDEAEKMLDEEFDNHSEILNQIFNGKTPAFEASLRWPRTFEISVIC